jgi:hypothetical protein
MDEDRENGAMEPEEAPAEPLPTLPKAVMQSMVAIFAGFFIPFVPPFFSIWLGIKIIRLVKTEPERYTGVVFGWFAIVFPLVQLAAWSYMAAVTLHWLPPPPR